MTVADLDAVAAIAVIGFPDHFEGRDLFENRLSLNPSGCFVLADGPGEPKGYMVAYPWRPDSAPALNTLLGGVPSDASVMYLHDLALHPDARGGGYPGVVVEQLAAASKAAGWPAVALVAVNDAAPFWARHGFVVRETPEMAAKLASYGSDARYMVRPL
ncbi:GNAT family N-acetyltransferase [Brevundimonas sp. M20]|nr:GNAT family N-acetyltransferase [Brevundimonas sp. M20]